MSSARPQQLALDLDYDAAVAREDFMVSPSNAAAVEAVDAWPTWPQQSLLVAGPAGSGKSHLVEVWRRSTGAARLSAAQLREADIAPAVAAGALAVEDIDRGLADERVLFHLLNLAREGRLHLLLTTRALPGEIAVALPDLRSRLRAMALACIEPPDEALLRALVVKLLADRQQIVAPNVVEYILPRIERSAEAAHEVVKALDRYALAARREITRPLAREVLAGLYPATHDAEAD